MKKINLQEKLQSIGKSAFVLLFEYLKNNTDPEIIKKELRDYKWIDSTFASRYSSSKAIFDNGYEIDALRNIINSSKVKKQYRELASNILDNYIGIEEVVLEEIKANNNTSLVDSLINYAYNNGFDESDIIDILIYGMNEQLKGDNSLRLSPNSNSIEVTLYQEPVIEDVVEENIKSDNISDFDINTFDKEDHSSAKFSINKKEFTRAFKNRLSTQNRKYANNYTYFPTIFKKLDIDFNDTINQQLNKIYTYILDDKDYKRINVNSLDVIKLSNGKLIGVNGKNEYELYFSISNKYYPFEGYISKFREVSLGHIRSVYNIIDSLDKNNMLNELKGMSHVLSKLEVKDIKLKETSDKYASKVKEQISISKLVNELELIEKEIEMELIPVKINISMGKN